MKMKKINPQLAQALDWIKQNKTKFKHEIFLPYLGTPFREELGFFFLSHFFVYVGRLGFAASDYMFLEISVSVS
jgi:hypothetical protein